MVLDRVNRMIKGRVATQGVGPWSSTGSLAGAGRTDSDQRLRRYQAAITAGVEPAMLEGLYREQGLETDLPTARASGIRGGPARVDSVRVRGGT